METVRTHSATVLVPTANASKYLQQLCKHWSHNLAVEFTPERGTVTFRKDARGADHPDDGVATMAVVEGGLEVRIDASAESQLEALKGRSPATSIASPSAKRLYCLTGRTIAS